jgi:hypothetical protein
MRQLAILRVDADEHRHRSVAGQIFRRRLACGHLAVKRNRIFQIDDNRIRAAGGGLGKAVGPVTRDEKERS